MSHIGRPTDADVRDCEMPPTESKAESHDRLPVILTVVLPILAARARRRIMRDAFDCAMGSSDSGRLAAPPVTPPRLSFGPRGPNRAIRRHKVHKVQH